MYNKKRHMALWIKTLVRFSDYTKIRIKLLAGKKYRCDYDVIPGRDDYFFFFDQKDKVFFINGSQLI